MLIFKEKNSSISTTLCHAPLKVESGKPGESIFKPKFIMKL